MLFKVIASTLDGEFNPVAQQFWNVSNGLTPRLGDYDVRDDERLNQKLVESIRVFTTALQDAVAADADLSLVVEILETFNSGLESPRSYTTESSLALCSFLDTLIEYEKIIRDGWDEDGTEEYEVLGNYVDIFANPNAPRPVLWHLINKIAISDTNWVCDDQKTPFLLYALGLNPVIGDLCFLEHLGKYKTRVGRDQLIATSTAYDAFRNPSLTIDSLEKLWCDYWWDRAPEWVEIYISAGLFNHALNFQERTSVGNAAQNDDGSPHGRIFALILARTFDELKLERLTWERMRHSTSKYFRTIAFYWPKTPVASKSKLIQEGIIELNEDAEEFLKYSFANPHISALSPDLARMPLP